MKPFYLFIRNTTQKIGITLFLCFTIHVVHAGNYTWNGSQSNAWSESTNWTPNGIPSTNDTINVNASTPTLHLEQNRTISRIIISGGTIDLDTLELYITQRASLNGGSISNGNFKIRGTYAFFQGTNFNCTLDVVSGQIKFSGGTFDQAGSFEQTGAASGWGDGGCTFNSNVIIKNSGATYLRMGQVNTDIFNGDVTYTCTGAYAIQPAYNDSTIYNGNVYLNSTGNGGIVFCNGASGVGILANGKTIGVGAIGLTAGTSTLKNIIQYGNTAQTLSTTSTLSLNGCVFSGSIAITATSLLVKGSTFNSSATFTKTGNANNYWDGSNVFNGTTTINNNTTGNGVLRMALQGGDVYAGDVNFNTSTGPLQVAFVGTSEFKGNININHNKVVFNYGSGTVLCSGGNAQTLSGSADFAIGKLALNKSSNGILLQRAATIDSSLTLTKGIIYTDTINIVTLKASGICSGASSLSYVEGPMQKIGNTSFDFPIGRNGVIRKLGIISPNNLTDKFYAEYFAISQTNGTAMDSTINYISDCNSWYLNQVVGSSSVKLKFYWDTVSCDIFQLNDMHLSKWDGSVWKDLDSGIVNGNLESGSITTLNPLQPSGKFLISYSLHPSPLFSIEKDTSSFHVKATFINNSNGFTPQAKFLWSFGDQCDLDTNLFVLGKWERNCVDTLNSKISVEHIYTAPLNYAITLNVLDRGSNFIFIDSLKLIVKRSPNLPLCEYVVNGSFNAFNFCPNVPASLGLYPPLGTALFGWYMPAYGTPDYFLSDNCNCVPSVGPPNACTSPCWIPNGYFGCEQANGNSAVGFGTRLFPGNLREYMQQQLVAPLIAGVTYEVSFLATLADNMGYGTQVDLGFSNAPVTSWGGTPLPIPAHISSVNNCVTCSNTSGLILKTQGWETIKGIYTAIGGEEYITVGNLDPGNGPAAQNSTPSFCGTNNSPRPNNGYLWVDDISIKPYLMNLSETHIDALCPELGSATVNVVSGSVGQVSYLWSNGSTSQTITNLIAGIYTCTVTDAVCSSFKVVTILDIPCCDGTINVNDNTLLTFTDISATDLVNFQLTGYFDPVIGTLTSNQQSNPTNALAINGTFTVDRNFTFYNCHILMGPNAKIVVESPYVLNFDNKVYMHSCGNYMWDGIYLETGGAQIKGRHLHIEDAKNAIVVTRGSNYSFQHTYFNKNWKSIVVEADEDKISNTTDCYFECVEPLFDPTGNFFDIEPTPSLATIQLIPHVNQRSLVGIEVEDVINNSSNPTTYVGLHVGADTWTNNLGGVTPYLGCNPCRPNTFYNLDFGIHATNSDLLILNNDFKGINNVIDPIAEGILLNSQPGTAILANNTNSTVPNNIFIGTDNQGSFNTLYKNTFEDGKRGVLLLNNVNGMINFNTFTRMTGSGVQLRNAINQSIDVIYNTFVDCVRGFFIRNASNLNGNTNLINVESNTYNYSWTFNPGTIPTNSVLPVFAFAHAGTSARAINLSIKNNTIQKAKTGIFLSNYGGKLFNFQVNGNTIGLDNDINKSKYGIRTTNCRYIKIRQNGIAKSVASSGLIPIGISLESALKNDLYENTLYKMGSGIGANISNSHSTLQCNYMDDNETGAYFQNSNLGDQGNPNLPSDNQFIGNNFKDIQAVGTILQNVWWTRFLTLPWGTANQDPVAPSSPVLFNLVTIPNIPAVNCDNPCVGPGCDQNRLLYIVENDTSFQQLSAEDQYKAKLNAFRIIQEDTSIFDMNLPSDSIFKSFYDSMLLENAGVFQYIEHSIHELDTTEARNYNELIVPENEMEAYLQIVNQIYLDTWARNNFELDSASIAILFEIANLSPEYFGEAVYLSRALLDENLDDYPTESSSNRFAMSKTNSEGNLLIFPNPSRSGYFTIISKDIETSNVFIEIFNLSGQLVESRSIQTFEKVFQLNLSKQEAGTYLIKFLCGEKMFRKTIIKLE